MKPFLKWAGGKYKIIDRVREKLPDGVRLIEPFVGSGAVFMNTDYSEYLLADANPDLINVFQHVQNDADFIDYAEQFFALITIRSLYFISSVKLLMRRTTTH